jgi:hypothetical protein
MPSSSNLAPRGDGSWGAILSRTIETLVLDHVPVVVRLAVLLSLGASQKHDGANPHHAALGNRVGLHYSRFWPKLKTPSLTDQSLSRANNLNLRVFERESAKSG